MTDTLRWTGGLGLAALLMAGFYLWAVRGAAILLDIGNFFCL